jgi:glyoxalase-like protein
VTFTFRNLVCAVPSFNAGNVGYERLGFGVDVNVGGFHTIGTRNALAYAQNGYMELLSMWDIGGARNSPRRRAILEYIEREAGGLIGLALHTDDLDHDIERLEDAGLCYGGPVRAQRKLDDGTIFTWQVLRPVPQPCPAVMPVLISGQDPEPANRRNPNTVQRFAGISIVTSEPDRLLADYATLLGSGPVTQRSRDDLGASAMVFSVGGFSIEILEVSREGAAAQALARFGPGPVELHLEAGNVASMADMTGLELADGQLVIPRILGMGIRMRVTQAAADHP